MMTRKEAEKKSKPIRIELGLLNKLKMKIKPSGLYSTERKYIEELIRKDLST